MSTRRLQRPSTSAALSPAGPPPTMTTSYAEWVSTMRPSLHAGCQLGQSARRGVCNYSEPMFQRIAVLLFATFTFVRPAFAQQPSQPPMHDQHQHEMSPATPGLMWNGWHVMQDGNVFLTFNRQGGPRGQTEFGSTNWWMGM